MASQDPMRPGGVIPVGVLGRYLIGTSAVAATAYQPLVLIGPGAVLILIVVGVMLPAVWSRKKDRREAARAVLRLLMPLRSRTPPGGR